MKKILTFNKVTLIPPSNRAAAQFLYHYSISDENSHEEFYIPVVVSDVVCMCWGFQFNNPNPEYYHNLNKVVVRFLSEYIIQKARYGKLHDLEEFKLFSENTPENITYKIEELPEVENLSFEFIVNQITGNDQIN